MSYIPGSPDLYSILPMLILALGGIFLLVLQFALPEETEHTPLFFGTLLFLLFSLFSVYYGTTSPGYGKYFQGQISLSPLTVWLNALYILCGIATLLVAPKALEQNKSLFPEFYSLLLFTITGMMFLTTGYDLLVIFIGLEILSLCLYILVGMARNSSFSLEAAMKYFLLGAFSSGFMLLGIAFLYGGSASTNLDVVMRGLFSKGFESNYAKIGFGLFLTGVFFKSALVPFHAWTPDVYEGAQTPITGFMASAGKVSSMGLLLVLFTHIPSGEAGNLWKSLVGGLALLSMTYGNIAALRQTNLKRILAYSSISHAGYICAGIAYGGTIETLYYLIVYSFMNLAAFAVISYLEEGKRQITLESISHLSLEYPWAAFSLAFLFLSFAGLPPLGGFWAKLFLLQKIAEVDGFFPRFVLFGAVANSAVAFYYYMRITIQAYMKTDSGDLVKLEKIEPQFGVGAVVGFTLIFLALGWIFFQPSFFV